MDDVVGLVYRLLASLVRQVGSIRRINKNCSVLTRLDATGSLADASSARSRNDTAQ